MSGKLTAYYDVGTTNLRLYLLDENLEPLAVRKRALGARDSAIAGTNRPLLELERRFPGQQAAVILPGSHTHVLLAGRGRLEGILSSFTGELFQAVRSQTVLSPVLETPSDHPDPDAARLGLENLRRYGFNRALYIGHAMRIFGEGTPRFRRCYCEAVISGGVIQALDAVCRERWRDCGAALVAAGPYLAELFSLLLEGSEAIRRWETLIISADRSFALEGLRRIIRIRERSHIDE